jgi:hypothetical protein
MQARDSGWRKSYTKTAEAVRLPRRCAGRHPTADLSRSSPRLRALPSHGEQ